MFESDIYLEAAKPTYMKVKNLLLINLTSFLLKGLESLVNQLFAR